MKESTKHPIVYLRPPIIAVLGHVDHGKTTLLDYIRRTNIAAKEAGGITQKIGASVVTTKEGAKITFIDTPGHAAFANMRSRGARVADIAILVVAGDDGVKPQTKEALEHILTANIPYIVAVTKIDLPTTRIDEVKSQLEKYGVSFEGRGGDVPLIGVSGKTGQGVEEFLEMITLVSEVHNVTGDPKSPLEAVIIETAKGKAGPAATIIVRNGTINVADEIITQTTTARVRGLFDYLGKSIKYVGPGEPAQVIGFEDIPEVGSNVWKKEENKDIVVSQKKPVAKVQAQEGKSTLVLKATDAGSIEAILANLPKDVVVVSWGVGEVTESDVFMAKAANAPIFAFGSKIPLTVTKLAESEGVLIQNFDVIYELFEKIQEDIQKSKVEVLGQADILVDFPYENKRVAGCKIKSGIISKGDSLLLKRKDIELGEVKVISIRKGKKEINQVKQGEECGIFFSPQLDFKVGDMLLSVR